MIEKKLGRCFHLHAIGVFSFVFIHYLHECSLEYTKHLNFHGY